MTGLAEGARGAMCMRGCLGSCSLQNAARVAWGEAVAFTGSLIQRAMQMQERATPQVRMPGPLVAASLIRHRPANQQVLDDDRLGSPTPSGAGA